MAVNESIQVEKDMEEVQIKPNIGIRLSDLKLVLGPELKIVYPFILNFSVSGELELNGLAHPKCIKPRGTLAFENGEVDLVATQVCVNLYFETLMNSNHSFFSASFVLDVPNFRKPLFRLIKFTLNAGEVKTGASQCCKV